MLSVEQCSRRFDFLRLHRWAWERKLIRKPRKMGPEHIDKHLFALLSSLCSGLGREYGFQQKVHVESQQVRIELASMATWLDEVKASTDLTLQLELVPPTSVQPSFTLPCWEGRVSCAAASFEQLTRDLETLAALDQEIKASETIRLKAPSPFGQVLPKRRKRRAA